MNDLRTAAQQALECLKGVARGKYDGNAAEVCVALEAALAEQRLTEVQQEMERSIESLKAASAQEQKREQAEPICKCDLRTRLVGDGCEVCNPELAAESAQEQAEPVREPVAFIHRQGNHWEVSERHLDEDEKDRGWTEEPLYTAPPKLVPLTDGALMGVYIDFDRTADPAWSGVEYLLRLCRAIERAHGIGGQDGR